MNIAISELAPHPLNRLFDQYGEKWEAMVGSVREHGVIQKPLVRPMGTAYQIVCGHRRVAAAEEAGLREVCCDVREMDDRTVLEILIVENLERENPDPVEEGKLLRAALAEGLEIEILAHRLKRSVQWIQTRQQLLDLGDEVLEAVRKPKEESGHLGMGAVEVILSVPASDRARAIQLVLHPEWTTDVLGQREAESVIKSVILEPARKAAAWTKESPGLVKAFKKSLGTFLTKDQRKDLLVQAIRYDEAETCKLKTEAGDVIPAERLFDATAETEQRWVHLAIFHGLPVWVVPGEGATDSEMAKAVVDERLIVLAETARAENSLPVTLLTGNAAGKKAGSGKARVDRKEEEKREERIEEAVGELEGTGDPNYVEEEKPETVITQTMESRAWVDLGPVRALKANYEFRGDWRPDWAEVLDEAGLGHVIPDVCDWIEGLKK